MSPSVPALESSFSGTSLDLGDLINAEIWAGSATLQARISDRYPSSKADILQAVLPAGPVPWVPDLAGHDWRLPGSILVVGSAYAPFIHGYGSRPRAMSEHAYRSASSARAFQQAFLQDVVQNDAPYYDPLARLLIGLVGSPRRAVVLDLVRGAFVKLDRFEGGDSAIAAAPELFTAYARAGWRWTWKRMIESESTDVLVLGQRAERGFLMMLAEQGAVVRVAGNEERPNDGPDIMLVASTRGIGQWLDDGLWWEAVARVDGRERRWRVLPIVHPARMNQHDPRYQRTLDLARRMLAGERPRKVPSPRAVPPQREPKRQEIRPVAASHVRPESRVSPPSPNWMPRPGKTTQRDVMRQAWARFGPDEERTITAYARAELAGIAPRESNTRGETAEDYARRLLYDGLAKGWLRG